MFRVIKLSEKFIQKYAETDQASEFESALNKNKEYLKHMQDRRPMVDAWNNTLKNMPKTLINAVGQAVTDSKYIQQLQIALKEKGYDLGKYGPDGKWGQWTFAALYNFQENNGIQPTGKLDQQTVTALGLQ